MDVTLAHPPEFGLMPPILQQTGRNAKQGGGAFDVVDSMDKAFEQAHVVYPFCWAPTEVVVETDDMPDDADNVLKPPFVRTARARSDLKRMAAMAEVLERHKDWICDEQRMDLANQDGIFMHCMPAATGYEVAPEVIDGPRSVVYDQAENVLHMAKAIMVSIM